jgi:menaquinone-dependent protoporphyrinogen oxidase
MKVLVAYATKHGATAGIAERIADVIRADGLDVDIYPAATARNVETYDAFVIGAAAYMYHWLDEASSFVSDHRITLAAKPTWIFSSGPIGTEIVDKNGRDVLEVARPKEFAEIESDIHPRDEHVFFGAYDPEAPPIGMGERIGTFFIKAKIIKEQLPAGDFRDWPKIETWAHSIASELKSEPVPALA